MGVGDLIERVKAAFPQPAAREPRYSEAINTLHEARDACRQVAREISDTDPKVARELEIAANMIATQAKRLWSL